MWHRISIKKLIFDIFMLDNSCFTIFTIFALNFVDVKVFAWDEITIALLSFNIRMIWKSWSYRLIAKISIELYLSLANLLTLLYYLIMNRGQKQFVFRHFRAIHVAVYFLPFICLLDGGFMLSWASARHFPRKLVAVYLYSFIDFPGKSTQVTFAILKLGDLWIKRCIQLVFSGCLKIGALHYFALLQVDIRGFGCISLWVTVSSVEGFLLDVYALALLRVVTAAIIIKRRRQFTVFNNVAGIRSQFQNISPLVFWVDVSNIVFVVAVSTWFTSQIFSRLRHVPWASFWKLAILIRRYRRDHIILQCFQNILPFLLDLHSIYMRIFLLKYFYLCLYLLFKKLSLLLNFVFLLDSRLDFERLWWWELHFIQIVNRCQIFDIFTCSFSRFWHNFIGWLLMASLLARMTTFTPILKLPHLINLPLVLLIYFISVDHVLILKRGSGLLLLPGPRTWSCSFSWADGVSQFRLPFFVLGLQHPIELLAFTSTKAVDVLLQFLFNLQ